MAAKYHRTKKLGLFLLILTLPLSFINCSKAYISADKSSYNQSESKNSDVPSTPPTNGGNTRPPLPRIPVTPSTPDSPVVPSAPTSSNTPASPSSPTTPTSTENPTTQPEVNSKFESATTGYNTKYSAGSELAPVENNVVQINGKIGLTGKNRTSANARFFRVFLPPGIIQWQAAAMLYLANGEAKVSMNMHSAPTLTESQVVPDSTFDTEKVLQKLYSGQNVGTAMDSSYGGGLKLSSMLLGATYRSTGGWVYLELLSEPAIPFMEINFATFVDATCYKSWFANARFDGDGNPIENGTHTCAGTNR